MSATIINIFSSSPPFGPPLTRTCASCCSWNAEEVLCENLVGGVPPEVGCDQHETHAEFWHGVENPTPAVAGFRRALQLFTTMRDADDAAKLQAVYKAFVALLQDLAEDTSIDARSQRLSSFAEMLTPVIGAGLSQLGKEIAHA